MAKNTIGHLITGATGFLGSALSLEILDKYDAQLVCLVRAVDRSAAQQRLLETLHTTAAAYGREDLSAAIAERVTVLRGDVSEPNCGVTSVSGITVTAAWHAAASLSFKAKARPSTLKHNVEGTANTLELARRLGAGEFNYVSTAYVAGTRTGLIREEPVEDPDATNNPYEESKVRAEMLVSSVRDLTVRIFRPTIVIGHSKTHAATSYAGLQAAVNGALEYRDRRVEEMLGERSLHALGNPRARMNLIPIDVAVANMLRVRESGSQLGIFHIANANEPTVGELNETVSAAVGIRPPVLIEDERRLTAIEQLIADDPRNRFQRPYLSGRRSFDLAHTTAAIGRMACEVPLDGGRLRPYVEWQVRRHDGEQHRAGLS